MILAPRYVVSSPRQFGKLNENEVVQSTDASLQGMRT